MSHHHDRAHEHSHGQVHWSKKPHVKWTALVVVGLMLAAMAMYVFSVDDSLAPGQAPEQRVPAAP